ncbi:MAG TPA: O-antigen translocase, partial [Flavobacterium sp.]|nr:O-antigen translocase [Flavobacterium sp.]
MKVKQNNLIKVLSLNSISVGISVVLGIASSKIISTFLGTSGMALLGSFRNFTAMMKSIATLGINNSIIKLFLENKDDQKEISTLFSTFFWIFLFISSFLGFLILLFSGSISLFLFYSHSYKISIQFFAVLLPLVVINAFWIAIYNGLEQFKRIVLIQILSNAFGFLITAFLIWNNNISGGLFAIAISEFIMVFITFLFVRRDRELFKFDLRKIISKKYFDVIKKFSAMALVSGIIIPLNSLLIRNNIVESYSLKEAGIWDAVNKLSGFYMVFFSSGLSLYYMPRLAQIHTDSKFKEELKYYFKTFVPLFFLMTCMLFFFKDSIIRIAFAEEFDAIKEMLVWQLLGDFFKI